MTDVVESPDDEIPVIDIDVGSSPVSVVEVVTAGPQGPPGPSGSGGSGSGGGSFQFVQSVAATVWTIEHDLGFDPGGISVVSADGYFLDGFGVQYLSAGVSLRLSFDISVGGTAYLS